VGNCVKLSQAGRDSTIGTSAVAQDQFFRP
jgi:hypothetical protein